jgi:hypothetical protein
LVQVTQQARQVGQAVAADLRSQLSAGPEALPGQRELGAPFGLQKVHGTTKILALPWVVEHLALRALKSCVGLMGITLLMMGHSFMVLRNNTTSSRGPWAPYASVC